MRFIIANILIIISWAGFAQSINGQLIDNTNQVVGFVTIQNLENNTRTKSNAEGYFEIAASTNDILLIYGQAIDTLKLVVSEAMLEKKTNRILVKSITIVDEVTVTEQRMADFDVGYLPPIKDVQIYTGTNAVIKLDKLNGAKSTANPREMFAKVPGLNIWESDGAGIQMGVGGRGLSPNRTANFNTRQNGYDISADALGYPESYYTPPMEALGSIEIIRGSASLQFGTQFGGLMNFIIKEAPNHTPFEFTTRTTGGSFNYLGMFNRVAGSHKRVFYQAYHQYKRGDGYRANSNFQQHQAFAQIGFHINEKMKIKFEYTHMNYLTKQAGGLSDVMFEQDARMSVRTRNWFAVNWNLLALHYDWEVGKSGHFNVRAFGMVSERKTLGFLGKITQADPMGVRDMLQGDFRNGGAEARYLQRYALGAKENIKGGLLVGGRFYKGQTTSNQGLATDGDDADFTYANPNNLEGSSYSYPSMNLAAFVENIFFIGKRLTINAGGRFESIQSGSEGYYKQYVIHPINHDTLDIYTISSQNEVKRLVPLFGGGLSYKVGKRSTSYANITQNYRAINFTDIRVNNPNIVVDSNIVDEHGYTGEVGFRGLVNDYLIYDLAGFYVFYGDKIGLAPKAGTTQKERTNIGDACNTGVEAFVEMDWLRLIMDSTNHSFTTFVNASYISATYIRSKETNYIDKKVEYVSDIVLRAGVKYRYEGLSVQLQGNYNSQQFADASNSIEPSGDAVVGLVPAYFVMDASVRYAFKQPFQIELGVNNVLNEKYFTRRATAYPGPGILPSDGRSVYLTLQYKFTK